MIEEINDKIINYGSINNNIINDMRVYKVYAYISPSNKIYIGQTYRTLEKRSGTDGNAYKKSVRFYNAIKKYGFDNFKRVTLIDGLSKEMADIIETELIKKYNTRDDNFGYNIGLGGNTNTKFLQVIYQYDLSGNFVKEYKNIHEVNKEFGQDSRGIYTCLNNIAKSWRGYMWSYEKHDKIEPYNSSVGDSNGIRVGLPVYQYGLDGCFINEYKNISEVIKETGFKYSTIYNCLSGQSKTACRFQWSYIYYDKMPPYNKRIQGTPIYQYDLDGNYLSEFAGIEDARKRLGLRISYFTCASGNRIIDGVMSSHNYYWSYKKYDKICDDTLIKLKFKKGKNSKTIYKYSIDGEFINKYINLTHASSSIDGVKNTNNCMGAIRDCCNGKYYTAYGYVWSFTVLSKEEITDRVNKSKLKSSR